MKTRNCQSLLVGSLLMITMLKVQAQSIPDSLLHLLLGRWDQLSYSEQGVPVNKKASPIPQALAVYEHNRRSRAEQWYGITDYEDLSRRENKNYERWLERDSTIEVRRLAEAIALPYFVAFFADSTVAMYNKDTTTGIISFPEARKYIYSAASNSVQIFQPGGYSVQWHAQILLLNSERLILFLAEEAEVVEFMRAPYTFP